MWRPCWRAEVTGEARAAAAEAREGWRDLVAEIRQHRQLTLRLHQRITGKDRPTRREVRRAERVILGEAEELEAIERRVIAEHERGSRQ